MNLRESLLAIADAYCAATGRARGTVSAIILNRGSKLAQIAEGKSDVGTVGYERSMAWFSANWPDGLAWPDDCLRPKVDTALVVEPKRASGAAKGSGVAHRGENAAKASGSHANSSQASLHAAVNASAVHS